MRAKPFSLLAEWRTALLIAFSVAFAIMRIQVQMGLIVPRALPPRIFFEVPAAYSIITIIWAVCILVYRVDRHLTKSTRDPNPSLFLGFWEIFGFLFPKSIQERVWDPAVSELKSDWVRARIANRPSWERRWLNFCFLVRTIGAVIATFGLVIKSKTWEKIVLGAWTLFRGPR